MKILVTGGAGYVGSCLVPKLLQRGYDVYVLDSLIYNQIQFMSHFIDDQFHFIKGDIRDKTLLKKVIKEVDVIVHLAAIVGAPACKKNPELAQDVNCQGTKNIVELKSKDQFLLYASTGSVYGKIEEICNEDVIPNPLSVYGQTKLKAEQLSLDAGNSAAFRFATAFGLAPRLRIDLLPNDFVLNALKNKYLVIYDKDFRRTFIHVQDIADSYIFAIDNHEAVKDNAYNVGSENLNYTKEEIANLIKNRIDFQIYFADKGIPDPDQRDYEVSYEKIRKKGFATKISFEKGLDELIRGLNLLPEFNPFSNITG